jgi:hypothetical protein
VTEAEQAEDLLRKHRFSEEDIKVIMRVAKKTRAPLVFVQRAIDLRRHVEKGLPLS